MYFDTLSHMIFHNLPDKLKGNFPYNHLYNFPDMISRNHQCMFGHNWNNNIHDNYVHNHLNKPFHSLYIHLGIHQYIYCIQ